MKRKIHLLVYLALASLLAACALRPSEREMNYLASALTKVSAAVDATVRFRPPPAAASEAEMLQASTAHDPGLLRPFADYILRVQRSGRASAVLVCDRAAKTALLEDAGCTARADVCSIAKRAGGDCEQKVANSETTNGH